jgi:hypothetical protein
VAQLRLVRLMRALLVARRLAATVARAATSVEDPRTTAELEQFYGAIPENFRTRAREVSTRRDQGAAHGHLQPASRQDAEEASSDSLWTRRDRRPLLLSSALLLSECPRIRQRRL